MQNKECICYDMSYINGFGGQCLKVVDGLGRTMEDSVASATSAPRPLRPRTEAASAAIPTPSERARCTITIVTTSAARSQ